MASGDLWAGAEVQVHTLLKCLGDDRNLELGAILFNEGELASRLKKLGIQVWVLPENEIRFPILLWQVIEILRRFRPHIVHTHRYKENLIGAVAGKLTGAQGIVRTQHGAYWRVMPTQPLRSKLYQKIDAAVAKYATDRIICVSKDIRTHFETQLPRAKLVTIPNGIFLNGKCSIPRQSFRQDLRIPLDSSVIGTVCRLVNIKGLDILLRTAKLLREQGMDTYFVIVGDGPEKNSLESLAASLEIEDRVRFTGFRADARDLLRAFDVFVLPSLHEGTPMALLEAMCEGIACVATSVGGVPEMLEYGQCGTLVPPMSPEALAQACARVLDDSSYRNLLVRRAKTRVMSDYDAQIVAKHVSDSYHSIARLSYY